MSAATSAEAGTSVRHAPSAAIGTVLFVAWGIETIMWVASTIHLASNGESSAITTAVAAIALLCLLAAMEGLEVAVIDRWKVMYPERSTAQLAKWLAARQLFVALIVTTATILAHRSEVIIPWTGVSFDEGFLLAIFDLTWTGFTVLWFAQILPKHLAATNPDRYLSHLRRFLFPVVEVVNQSGIPRPGAWTARVLERRLNWPLTQAEEMQEAVMPREESLGRIWRELNTEEPARGATRSHDQSQPERPAE
jgi:Mg2+/Co2+ transporter CorB